MVLTANMTDFVVSSIASYKDTMRMIICRVRVDWGVNGYGESFRSAVEKSNWSLDEFMPRYIMRENSNEPVSYITGHVKYLIVFPKK